MLAATSGSLHDRLHMLSLTGTQNPLSSARGPEDKRQATKLFCPKVLLTCLVQNVGDQGLFSKPFSQNMLSKAFVIKTMLKTFVTNAHLCCRSVWSKEFYQRSHFEIVFSKGLLIRQSCWEQLAMKTCAAQRFSHKKILLETSYPKNICCPNVFSSKDSVENILSQKFGLSKGLRIKRSCREHL